MTDKLICYNHASSSLLPLSSGRRGEKNVSSFFPQAYQTLYQALGPQHWWPGENVLEIAVGAILTQNTAWSNVERAMANLKQAGLLPRGRESRRRDIPRENEFANGGSPSPQPSPQEGEGAHCKPIAFGYIKIPLDEYVLKLFDTPLPELAQLLRPAGYFNVKSRRLRNFLERFLEDFQGDFDRLFSLPVLQMRTWLLGINGIGRETADSIILYAARKKIFVVDAYTRRILYRHGALDEYDLDYDLLQEQMEGVLPRREKVYNEFHALIVRIGKTFCRTKPLCEHCPLNHLWIKKRMP